MRATLHIPKELLEQVQRLAESQGHSVEEVAAEAIRHYLAQERVNELRRSGKAISEQRDSLYDLFAPVRGLLTDQEIDRIFSRE